MRPKVLEENIDNFNLVTKDTIERLAKIRGTSGQDGEIPDLEGELKKWTTESRYSKYMHTHLVKVITAVFFLHTHDFEHDLKNLL